MATQVWYTTIDKVKIELVAETAADDAEIREYLDEITTRINQVMADKPLPYFAPYQAQQRFPLDSKRLIDGGLTYKTLFPLQSVSEVLIEAVDLTADVELDYPNQGSLRWIGASSNFANELVGHASLSPRLNITGVWGFSRDYANAWLDSGDTVDDNPLSSSATTLTVTDSTLFEEGQLLQIESEWLLVETVATATTLTVKRGVHGTTGASHIQGTQIDIFQVDEAVQLETAKQVALWYSRQGGFSQQVFDGIGVTSYPTDLLPSLKQAFTELTYVD